MRRKSEGSAASVLLICDSYPPVMGGSEIEAQRVCAGLIRRGHRVQVLCSGGPPMPPVRDWMDPAGVPVRILTRTSQGRWKHALFALRVAWTIWRERHNYDLVYFLMQGLHLATGLPAARFAGKTIVVKISGSGVIPLMRRSRMGPLELGWMAKWASRVMVLNEGMLQEALDGGLPKNLLTWMPNPVDTNEFRPGTAAENADLRARYGIAADAKIVLYVGRLSQEKGLLELMRAFAAAARRVAEAMLILVGDGPMRPQLETLADELGLTPAQIRFPGRVDSSEVPLWLRAADVFALTSPNEGFPCALAEAMSAGLASVVSRVPGNTQLVDDGVHGITVALDDCDAIAGALVQLLNDPELRRRMGQVARERVVERYSTDQIIDRYEALFSEVLARRAG